jgi:hypothetical protein
MRLLAFFKALERTEQMPANFLLELLCLLSKRYYELCTKEQTAVREEYLLVQLVKLVQKLYGIVSARIDIISKDQVIIIMSATVTFGKRVFEQSQDKQTDLRSVLLELDLDLVKGMTGRKDFKIEEIYPKQYSFCSNVIKGDKISVKEFTNCLQIMELLIRKNEGLRSVNEGKFIQECLKRLAADVGYFVNVFPKYEMSFQNKLRPFS